MKEPIRITTIKSRLSFTAQMLNDCYFFEMSDGVYNLYSSGNVLLAEKLETQKAFSFTLGPLVWSVDKDFVITPELAHGNWQSDVVGTLFPRPSIHDAEDEGTFHATAGGHVPEKPEKKANTAKSASGY